MLVQALSGSVSGAIELSMACSPRLTVGTTETAHFPSFYLALSIEYHRHMIHPRRTFEVPVVHMGV